MKILQIFLVLAVILAAALGVALVTGGVNEERAMQLAVQGGIVLLILATAGLLVSVLTRNTGGRDNTPR